MNQLDLSTCGVLDGGSAVWRMRLERAEWMMQVLLPSHRGTEMAEQPNVGPATEISLRLPPFQSKRAPYCVFGQGNSTIASIRAELELVTGIPSSLQHLMVCPLPQLADQHLRDSTTLGQLGLTPLPPSPVA